MHCICNWRITWDMSLYSGLTMQPAFALFEGDFASCAWSLWLGVLAVIANLWPGLSELTSQEMPVPDIRGCFNGPLTGSWSEENGAYWYRKDLTILYWSEVAACQVFWCKSSNNVSATWARTFLTLSGRCNSTWNKGKVQSNSETGGDSWVFEVNIFDTALQCRSGLCWLLKQTHRLWCFLNALIASPFIL